MIDTVRSGGNDARQHRNMRPADRLDDDRLTLCPARQAVSLDRPFAHARARVSAAFVAGVAPHVRGLHGIVQPRDAHDAIRRLAVDQQLQRLRGEANLAPISRCLRQPLQSAGRASSAVVRNASISSTIGSNHGCWFQQPCLPAE